MTDFQALYERYATQVRRFALYLGGDGALADDITAETFVRVWTASGTIRQETVKAYLFTIARNLYHDSIRRAHRFTALDEGTPDRTINAQQLVEDRSALKFVLSEIQQLPEIDRAALLMRAQEQMSYEEISRILDLSISAVKVKVHRARVKLMHSTKVRSGKNYKTEKP